MRSTNLLILLISSSILFSCTEEKKPASVQKPVTITKLPQPFTFHKAIEVKPGLTLDVLSWGRGSESVGAYLILRSDSAHFKYRSFTGELDGKIQDAWNMDMDSDGNPELYIHVKGEGEGSHFTMYVYEFNESGSANELRFPDLSSATKKKYRGKDSIYIKDDKLRREFPLFSEEQDSTESSGNKKVLEYTLRGNTFSIKEIKEEEKDPENKKSTTEKTTKDKPETDNQDNKPLIQ